MRVVSTSPSSTEILYALGIEPVAVSHACDYPPPATDLPAIDVSKVDATASADRHAQARAATADGHLYRMDAATLDALEPDLIVTQGVCGVCAVDDVLVGETLSDLSVDPEVLSLQASTLADVFACIRQVGAATSTEQTADRLVKRLRDRVAAVERRRPPDGRPETVVLEWLDPLRGAGRWVPDVVTAAGGKTPVGVAGESSVPIAWERLRSIDPDRLVVAPCGFDLERTRERQHELTERPGWADLTAVSEDAVYALDGSSYLTRWTPRLVDAVEHIASVCHPDAFGAPTDADGVVRLSGCGWQ